MHQVSTQTDSDDWDSFEEDSGDTFGFSFVDMVSGGFGAAFFLFLVFVTLPLDSGNTVGGGDRFIQLWLTWENLDESYEPIVEYLPPAKQSGPRKNWRVYRMSSGQLSKTDAFGVVDYPRGSAEPFWTRILAAGFSEIVAPTLRQWTPESEQNADDLPDRNLTGAGVWLHFADPCPGQYRVRVNRNAGFQEHLISRERLAKSSKWEIVLEAPNLPGPTARLKLTEANTKEADASGGLSQFAPLIAFDANPPTPEEKYILTVREPIRKGTDLDHCG